MKKLFVSLAVAVSAAVLSFAASNTQTHVSAEACVDTNVHSNVLTEWPNRAGAPGTVHISTKGKAPCHNDTLWLASFKLPANYDNSGAFGPAHPTSYPQTLFASVKIPLTAGQPFDKTITVALPNLCENAAQVDIYNRDQEIRDVQTSKGVFEKSGVAWAQGIVVKRLSENDAKCKPVIQKTPNISINKTVNGQEHIVVGVGVEFTYEITVKNTGNVTLTNAVVTDTPQAGVTLISGSAGSVNGNVWTVTIPTLGVGESKSYTLTAKVPVYKAGTIVNTVCVETPTIPGTNPDDCDTAEVEVPTPGKVRVCDIQSGNVISVSEADKDNEGYAPADSPECQPIRVCDTTTKTHVTIRKSQLDDSRYTTDDSACVAQPEPPVIPSTGPTEAILSTVSFGAIAGTTYYWRSSRRRLLGLPFLKK